MLFDENTSLGIYKNGRYKFWVLQNPSFFPEESSDWFLIHIPQRKSDKAQLFTKLRIMFSRKNGRRQGNN